MSHVINPTALRLGTYSLNWTYRYKFSQVTKMFKLHLELNFLLRQFLKIYGINLFKYHISFESDSIKLSLIIFRYVAEIPNQKFYNYLKEDIASLNNPFVSIRGIENFCAYNINTKFLTYRRSLARLRTLGLRKDFKRISQKINYSWFLSVDSIDDQLLHHDTFKFFNAKKTKSTIKNYFMKKFFFYLHIKRSYYGYLIPVVFRLKKFLSDDWFEKFERFGRNQLNNYSKGFYKISELKRASRLKKIKLASRLKKRLLKGLKSNLLSSKKVKKLIKKPIPLKSVYYYFNKVLKKKIYIHYISCLMRDISFFFYVHNIFHKFLLLSSFKNKYEKKKKKNWFIFKPKIVCNSIFNRFFYSVPFSLLKKKQFFLSDFLLKTNKAANSIFEHLSKKMLILSLSTLMLNRFNLIFSITLFNVSSIFKNLGIRNDFYENLSIVKKWSLVKNTRSFNYFYLSLLISIRLRITGPLSVFVSIILSRNVSHYKLLFCLKNVMVGIKLRSPELSCWKGTVIDVVGRINGSDRKKYCRYSSSRMFPLSTFDTIVNQTQKRVISKYGLINVKVLTFWSAYKKQF